MVFSTKDAYTGTLHEEFPIAGPKEITEIIGKAEEAFLLWRDVGLQQRLAWMSVVADRLDAERASLAGWISLEMGKPLEQAIAEISKCAWLCRHYAKASPGYLAPVSILETDLDVVIHPQPLGPILGIMPWNFPFWQALRFAIPALCAGNTVILKPAPQVPRCSLELARILSSAIPVADVMQVVFADTLDIPGILADFRLRGVALTGSDRAGRAVAASAGSHLKTAVLELGGADPFLVMQDADISLAARVGALSRMSNNGQTCIAAKRFIVHESVLDSFRKSWMEEVGQMTWGEPREDRTFFSCLSRVDLAENLEHQVRDAVDQGADISGQVGPAGRKGSIHPAMLLEGIKPSMRIASEEVFGPVATLQTFTDDEEGLNLCNTTKYGLGASVWTSSPIRAMDLALRIQAGTVAVNGMVRSDPRVPFGGIRDSGFGRELGREGILAFCNLKSIVRRG